MISCQNGCLKHEPSPFLLLCWQTWRTGQLEHIVNVISQSQAQSVVVSAHAFCSSPVDDGGTHPGSTWQRAGRDLQLRLSVSSYSTDLKEGAQRPRRRDGIGAESEQGNARKISMIDDWKRERGWKKGRKKTERVQISTNIIKHTHTHWIVHTFYDLHVMGHTALWRPHTVGCLATILAWVSLGHTLELLLRRHTERVENRWGQKESMQGEKTSLTCLWSGTWTTSITCYSPVFPCQCPC
jgi:hypothetical protein